LRGGNNVCSPHPTQAEVILVKKKTLNEEKTGCHWRGGQSIDFDEEAIIPLCILFDVDGFDGNL
jgi:hypothetical protein